MTQATDTNPVGLDTMSLLIFLGLRGSGALCGGGELGSLVA